MPDRALSIVALAVVFSSNALAQELIDVSKITCEQYVLFRVADPQYIAIWLSGYFSGKRNNMIIDVTQFKSNSEKLMRYCEGNIKDSVVDAVEKLFAPNK